MDKLSYIKQRFEGNFDVKYREVKTIIGDGTLVFIDDLCNGQWMMEYLILPLRGFGELKDSSIKTPNDLLEKVLDISAAGMAKDLDDAVNVKKNDDGTYTLGVHIADVSYYVKSGSKLDKEAITRGTSIYMMDRVIPMLPKELSNGICSLNEQKDRFAISVIMKINEKGKVVDADIFKSVISSFKLSIYV